MRHTRDSWTLLCYVIALCLIGFFKGYNAVQITRLSMPRWVQNGTEDSVVLDCEYSYSEDDVRLVVKWFLNDDPEPIYQWIPELDVRHASTVLRGRLNMDYTVSPSSPKTKFRALNILRPTTDLSGRYSCHVVSLLNQDAADQTMIVYAPPRNFEFNFTRTNHDAVNFTCEADGVYPLPQIALFHMGLEESDPELVSGVKTTKHYRNGAFNIAVSREIRDRELRRKGPSMFECVLSIPGTDYEHEKKVIYLPGSLTGTASSRTTVSFLRTVCTSAATVIAYMLT